MNATAADLMLDPVEGDAAPSEVSMRVAGETSDAAAIHRLIEANVAGGHLLPRTLDDVAAHARRFVVAEHRGQIIGCAELAPLSRAVAEVRSLVVDAAWRGRGLGSDLIARVSARAREAGFNVLCAFTHVPHQFVRLGFSIVPHVWFPEKVALDCIGCAKFRSCGQYAMALSLTAAGLMPTLRQLREPLVAGHTGGGALSAARRPVRLKVIA
jgi:amino-acid N-acetyltransferase